MFSYTILEALARQDECTSTVVLGYLSMVAPWRWHRCSLNVHLPPDLLLFWGKSVDISRIPQPTAVCGLVRYTKFSHQAHWERRASLGVQGQKASRMLI
jgi:hypothetical protein